MAPGIGIGISPFLSRGGINYSSYWETLLAKFTNSGTGEALLFNQNFTPTNMFLALSAGTEVNIYQLPAAASWVDDGAQVEMEDIKQSRLYGGVYGNSDSCTRSGSWTINAAAANYSGYYCRASATGAYIETTTPAGVTEIGIMSTVNANCGIQVVSIDGDNKLANLLPTAQQLVDDGSIANTCLVANGGTLNPTDRIFDLTDPLNTGGLNFLSPSANIRIKVASGLTAGAHTIRVTNTGYLPAGASTAYLRINGFYFDDPAALLSNFPVSILGYETTDIDIISTDSDNNFAFSFKPTAASGYEWIGHSGSCFNTSVSLYVDDVLTELPAAGASVNGSEIKIVVVGEGFHSEQVEKVLDFTQIFTFNPSTQLTVESSFTWLTAGNISGYGYQLAATSSMNKGSILEATEDYTLNSDDETANGNIAGSAAYIWDADGEMGIMLSVAAYVILPVGLVNITDRLDGINKIYFASYSGIVTDIDVNHSLSITCNYRIKRFVDGADSSLART